MRIAYLLPAKAGGGGVHSVVQEAGELAHLGVDVKILVPAKHAISYRTEYATSLVRRLAIIPYDKPARIAAELEGIDVAVATVFTSVRMLSDALDSMPKGAKKPRPAYYIQDYEPLFCEPGTPLWDEASASYTHFPDALLFAKTQWLCDQVAHNHGRRVEKVEPSLDHTVFYPNLGERPDQLVISAMIRPSTPRRAPRRTVRTLNWLAEEYGPRVELHAFGCDRPTLDAHALTLDPRVTLHGHLRREQVAEILRASTFFLDLSDYQAFGRTGLEAMACGCIPVMPALGGAPEIVVDGLNGLLIDTATETSLLEALRGALAFNARERAETRVSALATSASYSVRRAGLSVHTLLT